MLAANNEQKSCPRLAPAPIKPNNLDPDSLSMTSITLAQVDDISVRLSKATSHEEMHWPSILYGHRHGLMPVRHWKLVGTHL